MDINNNQHPIPYLNSCFIKTVKSLIWWHISDIPSHTFSVPSTISSSSVYVSKEVEYVKSQWYMGTILNINSISTLLAQDLISYLGNSPRKHLNYELYFKPRNSLKQVLPSVWWRDTETSSAIPRPSQAEHKVILLRRRLFWHTDNCFAKKVGKIIKGQRQNQRSSENSLFQCILIQTQKGKGSIADQLQRRISGKGY